MESAGHIARAQACGGDWYRTRTNLGNGMTGRVNAASTQCGAPFVAKGALPTTDKDRGGAAVRGDCFRMLIITDAVIVRGVWWEPQAQQLLLDVLPGNAWPGWFACTPTSLPE